MILMFFDLTILFVPQDFVNDQNHFIFNNHDYNYGRFTCNIQLLMKCFTKNEIYGDPCYNINVLMSHAASKMKHDYYEIVMRFGPHKFCFHSYTLRIP